MEQDVQWAMQQIRAWLRQWPDSADTAAGVHEYWIEWGGPGAMPEVTEEALRRLQQEGEVECFHAGRGAVWRKARGR